MTSEFLTKSFCVSALLSVTIGCGSPHPVEPDVRELTLHFAGYAGRSIGMGVGSTIDVIADVRDAGGRVVPGVPVAFSSTKPTLASVSSAGTVTAVATGECYIVAVTQGKTGSLKDS